LDEEEFDARLDEFSQSWIHLWEEFEKANPEWFTAASLQVFRFAIEQLRECVEDPELEQVSWDSPEVTIPWPVDTDEQGNPALFLVTPEDLCDKVSTAHTVLYSLFTSKAILALQGLTRDVFVFRQGDVGRLMLPADVAEEFDRLSQEAEERRTQELLDPEPFSLGFSARDLDQPEKGELLSGSVEIQFVPLEIDERSKEAYFPIVVYVVKESGHAAL
jgi:hypothetical protein